MISVYYKCVKRSNCIDSFIVFHISYIANGHCVYLIKKKEVI